MALKWDGFSEEDINKLKSQSSGFDESYRQSNATSKSTTHGRPRSIPEAKSKKVNVSSQNNSLQRNNDLSDCCQVGEPVLEVCSQLESLIHGSEPALNIITSSQDSSAASKDSSSHLIESASELKANAKKSLTSKLVLPSLSQPPPTSINLSDFRTKHRLMEEQNRARKVFLAKALEDRKKQTHAEQLRLSMIQEELQKLDQRLSCDVSIIRNQIEAASLEFMEAQKRYDRAEREFLDAKLLLYNKLERKELLTHHLCTIIEQNEMRKAQKLSELMEKLQMPEVDGSQGPGDDSTKQLSDQAIIPSVVDEKKIKDSAEIILTPSSGALQSDNATIEVVKSLQDCVSVESSKE